MKNGLLAFSGVNTKIRAMQKNFITEEGYREIVSLPDVSSVINYLRRYPCYKAEFERMSDTELHRGNVEFLLGNSVYEDYAKIYHFCNEDQKKFLREYARRYAIKYLKTCLSYAFIGKTPNPNVYLYRWFYDKYTPIDMDSLFHATTVEATLEALKGTEYYPVLSKVHENPEAQLFDYETALDMYHFRTMWNNRKKLFSKEGCEVIASGFGTKFDLLNIWYIHRARQNFHMSEADTYALTIPILYKLNSQNIREMVEAESWWRPNRRKPSGQPLIRPSTAGAIRSSVRRISVTCMSMSGGTSLTWKRRNIRIPSRSCTVIFMSRRYRTRR